MMERIQRSIQKRAYPVFLSEQIETVAQTAPSADWFEFWLAKQPG